MFVVSVIPIVVWDKEYVGKESAKGASDDAQADF